MARRSNPKRLLRPIFDRTWHFSEVPPAAVNFRFREKRKADLVDFRLGEQCALRGAAGGIALISSLGNLGPAVAPSVTGLITASTGSPLYSTYLVAAAYVLSGLLLLILVRPADPSRVADVRRERSFTFLGKPSRNIPVHGPQRPGSHLPPDPFSVTEP